MKIFWWIDSYSFSGLPELWKHLAKIRLFIKKKHRKYCPLVFIHQYVKFFFFFFQAVCKSCWGTHLPCWKSVRPHPLISRASPVKTMLWSSTTSDTQPSVCPGVSSTVRNYRRKGTSPKTQKCLRLSFLKRHNTVNNMNEMSNLCFIRVSRRRSYRSLTEGYLQSLHWIWRWHSSAPPVFSSSTLCWWCGQHGSECWLSRREKSFVDKMWSKK